MLQQLPVGWAGRLVLLRLARRWRSLLTAILGVLLVAMIGASIPLYTAAIAQVGLIQRLEQEPPKDAHLFAWFSLPATKLPDLDARWTAYSTAIQEQARQAFSSNFPGWVTQIAGLGETTPMQVVQRGEDLNARMRVAYYDHWETTTRLLEGAWPAEPAGAGVDLEAALSLRAADLLDLRVNDEIILDQRGYQSSLPLRVRITGIISEADRDAPFTKAQNLLRIASSSQGALETNLLTTRASFLRIASRYVPETNTMFGWWVFFNHETLPFSGVSKATASVNDFQKRLLAVHGSPDAPAVKVATQSQLATILRDYASEVTVLNAPFGLLLLQIGVLALFFLVVMSALVRREERREVAMFQSRGATRWQVLVLDGLEGLVICGLMAAIAPFLARWLLGWIVPFLTRIDHLPLTLGFTVFAYSGVAACVSCAMLLATVYPILCLPLTMAGGTATRSERQLWWQRYYLDTVLMVVGLAGLWRLIIKGSPLTITRLGEIEADPLLLLAPALFFVAVGSILLRVFPAFSEWVAVYSSRQKRLEGALAAWQVSREPIQYGRITFLLTLAVGIGWLATNFHATLLRNQRDRASYAVGADIRIEEQDMALKASRVRPPDFYLHLLGVETVTQSSRFSIPNISGQQGNSTAGELLAIDSGTFEDVAYWRGDLGVLKLPSSPALERIQPGRALPSVPARIGVWVRLDSPALDDMRQPVISDSGETVFEPDPDQLLRVMTLWLRLRDSTGVLLHVPLESTRLPEIGDSHFGWTYMEGDLGTLPEIAQGELRLEAVYWRNIWNWEFTHSYTYRLYLSDLKLIHPDATSVALDWFTGSDRWDLLYDFGAAIEGSTEVMPAPDWPGLLSRRIGWTQDGDRSTMGLVLNYPESDAILAIVSQQFVELTGLLPGTTFQVGTIEGSRPWFKLIDSISYFPTLYPDRRPFLVVDQEALLYALNRRPSAAVYPSETWLRLAPDTPTEPLLETLGKRTSRTAVTQVLTVEQAIETLDTNPLLAGLIGLLYLAFGVALAFSSISLLTYAALTAQQRRTQFGVLRALGLSASHLVTSLALEQLIVMAVGVLLGALLGAAMSARVLPTLAFGVTGESVTPPFIVQVEITPLVQYGIVLTAVLALTFGSSVVLVRRLSLAKLLRFGEE
jgi:ABC-type antimicrobial peptide transport system permease subunit